MSLFQNPVSGETEVSGGAGLGKSGLKPDFPLKSKEAIPQTEVLEQPHIFENPQYPAGDFRGFPLCASYFKYGAIQGEI
jgi:hypothetical protein